MCCFRLLTVSRGLIDWWKVCLDLLFTLRSTLFTLYCQQQVMDFNGESSRAVFSLLYPVEKVGELA